MLHPKPWRRVLSLSMTAFIVASCGVDGALARGRLFGGRRCRPCNMVCPCAPPAGSCCSRKIVAIPQPAPPASQVIARGTFVSPKTGSAYTFVDVNDPGTELELARELALRLSPTERLAASNSPEFMGHDRKVAKTSIVDAPVEDLGGLADVLDSIETDNHMRTLDPPITEDADSDRVDEENRNVHFQAFLYATKREDDNDYHLILGSTSSATHTRFMTAEISGLPRTGPDRAKLKIPRQAFEDNFADSPIGSRYRKFDPPIPVEIVGSLFFDVDHLAGVVGPEGFRPRTAWEVHPVTEIVFEP